MTHLQNIASLFTKNNVEHPLIESYDVGEICIVSGKLVACDPLLTNDMEAFDTQFPTGQFPIIIHREKESGCIAYIEIVFGEEKIEKWKLATTPGQKIESLQEGEIFGYPVESGMGCIMDWETQNLLNQLEQEMYHQKGEGFLGIYEEFFLPHFLEKNGVLKQYAILHPYSKEHNLVAFETGFGEGFYASYIGFDKNNNPQKIISELVEIKE